MPVVCKNCGGQHPVWECKKPAGYHPVVEPIIVAEVVAGKLVKHTALQTPRKEHNLSGSRKDRHKHGYMTDYMRKRRLKAKEKP